MKVATEGDYRIVADGPVGDDVDPHLSFGQTRSIDAPLWFSVALSVVSGDLAIAVWWFRRRGRGQLKTIAALRDSGALTEAEFKAEKRRILDGK